ncbi:MAG: hypothetical protein IJS52_02725 [Bacilli bacterium]|nr:hypothetical protein [Bacilli bacterium]
MFTQNRGNILDGLAKVRRDCKNALGPCIEKNAGTFMEEFHQNNNKSIGYNVGKDVATILYDNRGGWWDAGGARPPSNTRP